MGLWILTSRALDRSGALNHSGEALDLSGALECSRVLNRNGASFHSEALNELYKRSGQRLQVKVWLVHNSLQTH